MRTESSCYLLVTRSSFRRAFALAAAAGLDVNRGVVVDRELLTSHANIYALGDCAEVDGINLLYVMPLTASARALAQTLAGTPTAVSYGPMPVTVKTPACPLVVSPPPLDHEGIWQVEGQGSDLKVLCHGADGALLGYALGLSLGWLLKRYQFIKLPENVYTLDHLPISITPTDVIIVGVSAMLLCFLATLYPARQAARLEPAEALRYE